MSLHARAAGERRHGSAGVDVEGHIRFIVKAVGAPAALPSADTAPLLRIVCDWLVVLPEGQTSCDDALFRDMAELHVARRRGDAPHDPDRRRIEVHRTTAIAE